MASGESLSIDAQHETAWMLMQGRVEITAGNASREFERALAVR